MITLLEYAKIADLRIVCEAVPRQAYQAIAIAGVWQGRLGGTKVTMAGHSLFVLSNA